MDIHKIYVYSYMQISILKFAQEGIYMFFSKKAKLKVLPERGASYAVNENGEPEVVYYRPNSNLFVNRKLDTDVSGFFVNIRRPVIFDVDGLSTFEIPKMPPQCDGFIFINYGLHKSRAYALKDPVKQTWPLQTEQ